MKITIMAVLTGVFIGLVVSVGLSAFATTDNVYENTRVELPEGNFGGVSGCTEVLVEEYDMATGLKHTVSSVQVCDNKVSKG